MRRKRCVNFIFLRVVVLVLGQGPTGHKMEMNYFFKKPSSLLIFL